MAMSFHEWNESIDPKPDAHWGLVHLMNWEERRNHRRTGWDAATAAAAQEIQRLKDEVVALRPACAKTMPQDACENDTMRC